MSKKIEKSKRLVYLKDSPVLNLSQKLPEHRP